MARSNTFIDVYILQSLPPSNINRDDAGSPKTATYGGVLRSRVSSQAWKRATRTAFANEVPAQDLATRTKRISGLIAADLAARGAVTSEDADRIAAALAETSFGIKSGKKATDTAYLLFFGHRQLERIVDLIADDASHLASLDDDALKKELSDHKEDVLKILATGHPVDVALFGRMVADIPYLNVDAAVQVGHALSTHAIQTEFDYFTAVDDENTAEETGAGMIGNVEYTSSTLYRYATIGLQQLLENLVDPAEVANAVRLFVDAFARSVPSGHQNSFAHRTLPSLVAVSIREDQPVNLVGAFEAPVRPLGDSGLASASLVRLAEAATEAIDLWGSKPTNTWAVYRAPNKGAETVEAAFGAAVTFPELLDTLAENVSARLASDK